MKRFLVANITNVEMRRLKIFMENSLKCLHSLGYFFFNEKLKMNRIPYQKKRQLSGST